MSGNSQLFFVRKRPCSICIVHLHRQVQKLAASLQRLQISSKDTRDTLTAEVRTGSLKLNSCC